MATKKSKRSTASKKSAATESTKKQTKTEAVEAPVVEEVVEVVEIEAPVVESEETTAKKATIVDMLMALNPAALIAELLGTFILTAIIIKLAPNASYGALGIALGLMALVTVFNKVSGAHLNPAISLAQWINRKINGVTAIAFVVAQVLGAILAFFVLTNINSLSFDYDAAIRKGIQKAGVTEEAINKAGGYEKWLESFGGKESVAGQLGIAKTAPAIYHADALTKGKEWVAMIVEVVGAVIFGFGVAYAARQKNCIKAGFAVGFGLFIGLTVAGGTAILNPAVASALGVFSEANFASIAWTSAVYVLGPVIGMSLGVFIYNMLRKNGVAEDTCCDKCAK